MRTCISKLLRWRKEKVSQVYEIISLAHWRLTQDRKDTLQGLKQMSPQVLVTSPGSSPGRYLYCKGGSSETKLDQKRLR